MRPYSCWRDLKESVGVAPQEWDACQPVFCFDQLADAGKLFWRQDADGSGELGSGDFPANGAGCDLDLRVVADALALPQFAIRHEVEFVVIFGKPDGRVHGKATFPEGGKADVTLAVNFCGDGHSGIVKVGPGWE